MMNSILLSGNKPCTGCGLCAAVCPAKCITMALDKQGFYAPVVSNACTGCGLCMNVCYKYFDMSEAPLQLEDKTILAAVNKNKDDLISSSSGGVAGLLASHCFGKGVNVYGVSFHPEEGLCKHIRVSGENDLSAIRTSKYLQSNTAFVLPGIKREEKHLFFGTPCQVYGLRKYIEHHKCSENFILVDFFCRGVPTQLLWKSYKAYIQKTYELSSIKSVNFRDKTEGWHRFSMLIKDQKGKEYIKTVYVDLFYAFYLRNACFSESCYACEFRHNHAYSDIRLADFWGEKYAPSNDGVSMVILLTQTGQALWDNVKGSFDIEKCSATDVLASQCFNYYPIHKKRKKVLKALSAGDNLKDIFYNLNLDKEGFYKKK